MLLNGGVYAHQRILTGYHLGIYRAATAGAKYPHAGLGGADGRQLKRALFSSHSYGHTGFTGTAMD
jgi:hypothetical protein